jgi:hypothetical protein
MVYIIRIGYSKNSVQGEESSGRLTPETDAINTWIKLCQPVIDWPAAGTISWSGIYEVAG